MKFNARKNLHEEHSWFAWHPVLASYQTPEGIQYKWVLFSFVRRKMVRIQGVSIFAYSI